MGMLATLLGPRATTGRVAMPSNRAIVREKHRVMARAIGGSSQEGSNSPLLMGQGQAQFASNPLRANKYNMIKGHPSGIFLWMS